MSPRQIIAWWELGRIAFNLLVGACGIISVILFIVGMDKVIKPGEDAIEPLGLMLAVPLVGILANIGYTLGWVIELMAAKRSERYTERFGLMLWIVGTICSMLIVAMPGILGLAFLIFH